MTRALGLFGDHYHDGERQREFFARAAPEVLWTVHRGDEWSGEGLEEHQLVVVACEDRVAPETSQAHWMSEALAARLVRFVEGGGGLLAFHAGMASYPSAGPYTALVGGEFQFHPQAHPRYRFVPTGVPHPLLEGVEPFDVVDELYFVRRNPGSTELLASAESPEYGASAAYWFGRRGKGRIVGLTPGHRPETFAQPGS